MIRKHFKRTLSSLIGVIYDCPRIVEARCQVATAIAKLALDLISNVCEATANVSNQDTAYASLHKPTFRLK